MQRALAIVAIGLGGCAHESDRLDYTWDDRRVLCSDAVDDMTNTVAWSVIGDQMKLAAEHDWVLLLHAHTPGVTISVDGLERVLATADQDHLAYVTYRDLVPGTTPHAGVALAFDDNAPAAWLSVQDTLHAHGAHVTYFVSRWATMTDDEHAQIHELADAGHDIEPHSVHHIHAPEYVAANGLDAYIEDEVVPSITALEDAGFLAGTTYAYPFGDHTPEIDAAVLALVDKVRTTPGQCPY